MSFFTNVPFGYTSYAPGFNNTSKHMDLLGGLGLGMSAINGIWNAISGSNNNRRQIEFARESQDKQMAFQREMFNAENAYNTPAMQMQRLIAAGINPVSAWSNGMSATTGNGQTSGTFTPGSPQTSPVPSPFAGMIGTNPFGLLQAQLNAERTKADIKKTGADTRNVDQMTKNAEINQVLLDYDRQKAAAAAPYYGKEAYNDIMKKINENDVLFKTAANLLKQGELIDAEKKMNDALASWYDLQKQYKELQLPYAISDIQSIIDERKSSAKASDAMAGYYTISSKDKLVDYYRKIDDAIELYLDEHGDIQVDPDKLKEVKYMALKEAQNRIRQQNQDYWNPFNYVGRALSAGATVTKKSN